MMFGRFTERAQKVLALAQEEAIRLGHNNIGTEHILLGLVREGEGIAGDRVGWVPKGARRGELRQKREDGRWRDWDSSARGRSGPPSRSTWRGAAARSPASST